MILVNRKIRLAAKSTLVSTLYLERIVFKTKIKAVIITKMLNSGRRKRDGELMKAINYFLEVFFAILKMIDNSRLGSSPTTYFGVTAVSSITIPDTFPVVLATCAGTSSKLAALTFTNAVISSNNANNPDAII